MGRHKKTVLTAGGLDRRSTGYYSTPDFVADFIADTLLARNPSGCTVFDPCVGRGEMVRPFVDQRLNVKGMDVLSTKPPSEIAFIQGDFIEYYCKLRDQCIIGEPINLPYDFYVANPPYNCHEVDYIRKNKRRLTTVFGRGGVLNMYSMFLHALIDCAKSGAVIGVITLDSFLTAKNHEPLRKHILRNCTIHHVLLCPTDLFLDQGADVRTCILVLTKETPRNTEILEINRSLGTADFRLRLAKRQFQRRSIEQLVLSGSSDNSEFIVGVPTGVRRLFSSPRLGDLFPCITGISTGADTKYLSPTRQKGYSVPFYKNPGSRRFYSSPDAYLVDNYLEIEKKVPNFMVRNKHLLAKGGITCSSMGVAFGAAYLPRDCTVGVNASIIVEDTDRWWLMAYLNSSLVTYIVRGVLNRSNMITSGYVSRIPIVPLQKNAKARIGDLAATAWRRKISSNHATHVVNEIDRVVFAEAKLDRGTIDLIKNFGRNVIKAA